jgi:hypothetical protein
MSDATRILSAIEQGDPHAAEQLLPLVQEERRRITTQKMAPEDLGLCFKQELWLDHGPDGCIREVFRTTGQRGDEATYIFGNTASTSNKDVFGVFTMC